MKKILSLSVIACALFASVGCDEAKKEPTKAATKAEGKKDEPKKETK